MPFSSEELKTLHEAAESILPAAKAYGKKICNLDPTFAEELLLESVDKILASPKNSLNEIEDLPAYLFVIYRRLLMSWYKDQMNMQSLENNLELESRTSFEEIEKKILLEEIVRMMNNEERFIYNCLVLGYSYEQISDAFAKSFNKRLFANALRSKFSKSVQKIVKRITKS